MRRYILNIFLILGVSFALFSCEDIEALQEHPKKVDTSTFMTNAEEVQSVINSIYYQLGRNVCFAQYLTVLSEAMSDMTASRGNYGTSYETGLTTGGVGFVKDTWAVLYRTIRFANEILVRMETADLSDADRNALTGEVRFLRAFSYSYLAKFWGGVPFFDENNMTDFNKPRTPEAEIWQFVHDEFKAAAELLPETVAKAGHPTKYSAYLLLSEACLYRNDWAGAAAAAEKVVNCGKYGLVDVAVADDFDKIYGYTANATKEEVFYLKYNRDAGQLVAWMYLCKPNPVFNTGAVGVWADYVKNSNIKNWDNNDLRYQHGLWKQTGNGTLNALTKTGMICLKFRDYETTGSRFANDLPLYKYSDALLYYAEAICRRDGKPDDTAMEMVNRVHRRAYGLSPLTAQANDYKLSDYSTSEKFIELVLKERGYETMWEGKRYPDLKRCGVFAEYSARAGRVASASAVKDAAYWWPIPEDEFNYNTALNPETDQNPGY